MPLLDRLRAFWRALAPEAAPAAPEPAVVELDASRFEFHWRGQPLLVDRRADTVQRGGRALLKASAIRTVDVTRFWPEDDDQDRWKVSLATDGFASQEIGRTRDDVEASIAAARLATALDVPVRAL